MKREGYLSWDEYFMGIALLSAQRSKDPGTQVGACIVSGENKILSVGYNGMPTGCCDDSMPWDREGDPLATKYLFVCHAELNAILNQGGADLPGRTAVFHPFPLQRMLQSDLQAGIREVVYREDKYADTDAVVASKKMFRLAGSLIAPICRAARP